MGKVKHCLKIINIMECELIIRPTLDLCGSMVPFWILLLMRNGIKMNVKK